MEEVKSKNGARRRVKVLTNLRRFNGVESPHYFIQAEFVGEGQSVWSSIKMFVRSFSFDAVVFSSETRPLMIFCLLKTIIPFNSCCVIGVDYILQLPLTFMGRISSRVKGCLLRKVDCFVLHFKDTSVYQFGYGIEKDRCLYVPFKVNYWESLVGREFSADGEYVFTAGRSFRDIPTFLSAMRQSGCPGVLLYEDLERMEEAGTGLNLADIPDNVRAIKNEGEQSWVEYIAKARVVVIPLRSVSGYAPGLSLYLMAMAMNKCVVITEGLATRGLISDEAVIVPPGDSEAMGTAVRRLWDDAVLREKVASRGRGYAQMLGGEGRLLADLAEICGNYVRLVSARKTMVSETMEPPGT